MTVRLRWTANDDIRSGSVDVVRARDGAKLGDTVEIDVARTKLPAQDRNKADAVAALLTREVSNHSDDRWLLTDPSLIGDPFAAADPDLPNAFWVDADGERVAVSGNPPVALSLRVFAITITWDAASGLFNTDIRRVVPG